jgi:hypothetical protein
LSAERSPSGHNSQQPVAAVAAITATAMASDDSPELTAFATILGLDFYLAVQYNSLAPYAFIDA